jgi:putative restriction endonuclease
MLGIAGVIVTRRFASYKDVPGILYHYPKARYHEHVVALQGHLVLAYEPRRGGRAQDSGSGGRSAFVALAFLGNIWDDPDDPTHAYVETLQFQEFPTPVPIRETVIPGKSLEHAVHEIPYNVAEDILGRGFALFRDQEAARVREGLADLMLPEELTKRPLIEVVAKRPLRDASFRYRVVEKVYGGRCAISGLRMTNGRGRAEADAAHIRPVSADGPDSVRNGLALTKTIHWAFDRGLVSLADDGRILTVERGIDHSMRTLFRADGLAFLPKDPMDWPHPSFLAWHRKFVFKGVA